MLCLQGCRALLGDNEGPVEFLGRSRSVRKVDGGFGGFGCLPEGDHGPGVLEGRQWWLWW